MVSIALASHQYVSIISVGMLAFSSAMPKYSLTEQLAQ